MRRIVRVCVGLSLVAACTAGGSISEPMVSADGRTLSFSVDSCNADISTWVTETPDEVVINVDIRNDSVGDDCLDSATVVLDAPLGDRIVRDGGSGDVIPLVGGS